MSSEHRNRDETGPRPRSRRAPSARRSRRTSAGAALLAMLAGFFVAGLLDAGAIDREIRGGPLGTKRTVQLALLKPMVALSDAVRLDRPAAALDGLLGRGTGQHHSLGDLAKEKKPKWPRAVTAQKPLRLLIIGDSMAQVLGSSLKNQAEDTELVKARLDYKVSSGLSRPDFFDWPQHMVDQLVSVNPDATVVIFGANDGQNVMFEGKVLKVGSESWVRVYRERIDKAMEILTSDGRRVYWVGNPIMREEGYRQRIELMNRLYKEQAPKHTGVTYVDTWQLFSDKKGRFAEYLRIDGASLVRVRGSDGIHYTRAGGDWAAASVLAVIVGDWGMAELSRGE